MDEQTEWIEKVLTIETVVQMQGCPVRIVTFDDSTPDWPAKPQTRWECSHGDSEEPQYDRDAVIRDAVLQHQNYARWDAARQAEKAQG